MWTTSARRTAAIRSTSGPTIGESRRSRDGLEPGGGRRDDADVLAPADQGPGHAEDAGDHPPVPASDRGRCRGGASRSRFRWDGLGRSPHRPIRSRSPSLRFSNGSRWSTVESCSRVGSAVRTFCFVHEMVRTADPTRLVGKPPVPPRVFKTPPPAAGPDRATARSTASIRPVANRSGPHWETISAARRPMSDRCWEVRDDIQIIDSVMSPMSVGSKRRPVVPSGSGTKVPEAPARSLTSRGRPQAAASLTTRPPGFGEARQHERRGEGVPGGQPIGLQEAGAMDERAGPASPDGAIDLEFVGAAAAEGEVPGRVLDDLSAIIAEGVDQPRQILLRREPADGEEIRAIGEPFAALGSGSGRLGPTGVGLVVDRVVAQGDPPVGHPERSEVIAVARPADQAGVEEADPEPLDPLLPPRPRAGRPPDSRRAGRRVALRDAPIGPRRGPRGGRSRPRRPRRGGGGGGPPPSLERNRRPGCLQVFGSHGAPRAETAPACWSVRQG